MAIGGKKKEIYLAAARLFRDKGYQASSMRQLAKEVNLEPSSLYSHISSKQEILSQICMSEAKMYAEQMQKIISECVGVLEILRQISYFHIETAIEDPISATVFSDEWKHLEEPNLTSFRDSRKEYESKIREIITRGTSEGVLIDKDSFVLFQTFLSSFKWIYLWNKPGRNIDKEALKRDITDVILRGIKK